VHTARAIRRLSELLDSSDGRVVVAAQINRVTVSQRREHLPVSREWVNLRDVCEEAVHGPRLTAPGDRRVRSHRKQ
jgi:hypothetical protein